MYTFDFSVVTLEKGRIQFTVKAKDKQSAIDKGFKALEKKGLSYGNNFECRLQRYF